ncbi:MAG: hypothetical protein AAF307_03275 [Pseudomonadota bacterium]
MDFGKDDEVLATVRASAGRRVLGLGCLGFLGLLLLYIAFFQPPTFGWQLFLVAMGAGSLWCADAMRRATASHVELTPLELRDADGTVIVRVADIVGLDRGFFAFKPSNGFLIKSAATAERVWRPGLWWRVGARIGIGGMTPASQTKFMSEILAAMIATRDSQE